MRPYCGAFCLSIALREVAAIRFRPESTRSSWAKLAEANRSNRALTLSSSLFMKKTCPQKSETLRGRKFPDYEFWSSAPRKQKRGDEVQRSPSQQGWTKPSDQSPGRPPAWRAEVRLQGDA